jgi:zinc and cadmium transporter
MLLWIIGFSVLGSIGAVAGATLFLFFPEGIRRVLVPLLISYATGTPLGAAFLGMIPASLNQEPAVTVMVTALTGIVIFFILEKFVLWRHCHDGEYEAHGRAGPLILIGDAFHNFVDGVMIAAAFLTSIPLGITAALAVIAHEVPQEAGDFAILLNNGYGRTKAMVLNGRHTARRCGGLFLAGRDARGGAFHPGAFRREFHLHRHGRPHSRVAPAGNLRSLLASAWAAASGDRHDYILSPWALRHEYSD